MKACRGKAAIERSPLFLRASAEQRVRIQGSDRVMHASHSRTLDRTRLSSQFGAGANEQIATSELARIQCKETRTARLRYDGHCSRLNSQRLEQNISALEKPHTRTRPSSDGQRNNRSRTVMWRDLIHTCNQVLASECLRSIPLVSVVSAARPPNSLRQSTTNIATGETSGHRSSSSFDTSDHSSGSCVPIDLMYRPITRVR